MKNAPSVEMARVAVLIRVAIWHSTRFVGQPGGMRLSRSGLVLGSRLIGSDLDCSRVAGGWEETRSISE